MDLQCLPSTVCCVLFRKLLNYHPLHSASQTDLIAFVDWLAFPDYSCILYAIFQIIFWIFIILFPLKKFASSHPSATHWCFVIKSVYRERHQSYDILVAKSTISRSRVFFDTHAYDALRLNGGAPVLMVALPSWRWRSQLHIKIVRPGTMLSYSSLCLHLQEIYISFLFLLGKNYLSSGKS